MKKKRSHIPQKNKVKAELQKEINSSCPFCDNTDVGHFQIHHVDEDPSNNSIDNLLLLCPTCHSKITKEDISKQTVINTKRNINNRASKIEFISVSVDSDNCGWIPYDNVPFSFEAKYLKSLFPIFNFSFINQSLKTVLLTRIALSVKKLPIGLAGPHIPLPSILRPIIKYKIKMPLDGETINTELNDEIEIPQGRAFKFQVELYDETMERFKPPFSKYAIYFEFGFNNDMSYKIPMILLNSNKYYEELTYNWIS
ncbi:HNH endonuclease signature motif containing protein [Winogradskyella sp. 4-2091]|uniref:HNH endonuclease signature motif containing protein n=1 Tax=Winogradskyella sp. 4-2091 TaxID=3381659 RepID=UPI0038914650